jgi:phosphoribosylamine--glycine ligase
VLSVTALGPTMPAARQRAYTAAAAVRFDGAHYRKDIAA